MVVIVMLVRGGGGRQRFLLDDRLLDVEEHLVAGRGWRLTVALVRGVACRGRRRGDRQHVEL